MAAAPKKSVVIVGANRGIGLKLAQALAGRDWTVAGSVRPQTLADPSTRELDETGAEVLTMDLTDEETIVAAAKAYGAGPLDMLINCAGVGPDNDPSWYGHVATRLTGFTKVNEMGECIAGIIDVIEGIDMRNTGTFVNWKNEIVPW